MALDPINSAIFNIADMIGLNSKSTKPAEVGFNLNEFKQNITKFYGISKNSLFLVNIYNTFGYVKSSSEGFIRVNRAFGNSAEKSGAIRALSFFCHSTTLPGLSLDSSATRRYGIGPNIKSPISVSYPDLNLMFYGDNEGNINSFFRHWMNTIVMNNFTGPVNSDSIEDKSADTFYADKTVVKTPGTTNFFKAPYQFEYKSQYGMTVEISLFDPDSRRFETRTFLDCYPIAIGDVNLSWANVDDFMRIPVTLTYSRYFTSTEKYPAPKAGEAGNLTLLQKLIKVGTVAQTLSTVKKPRSVADMINLTNNASIAGGGLKGLF